MAEYIGREAVVKYLRSREGNFLDDIGKSWSAGMEAAAITCEKFPAADVAPVRHGRWNDINSNERNPLMGWVCRCSLCGCPQDYKHNFCPHCGARMDLEDKT